MPSCGLDIQGLSDFFGYFEFGVLVFRDSWAKCI